MLGGPPNLLNLNFATSTSHAAGPTGGPTTVVLPPPRPNSHYCGPLAVWVVGGTEESWIRQHQVVRAQGDAEPHKSYARRGRRPDETANRQALTRALRPFYTP